MMTSSDFIAPTRIRAEYVKLLENVSYSDFLRSFLNIPEFDEDFYTKRFWRIIWRGLWNNKKISIPLFVFMAVIMWYLLETGLCQFVVDPTFIKGIFFVG
jgi:hypothetical protein